MSFNSIIICWSFAVCPALYWPLSDYFESSFELQVLNPNSNSKSNPNPNTQTLTLTLTPTPTLILIEYRTSTRHRTSSTGRKFETQKLTRQFSNLVVERDVTFWPTLYIQRTHSCVSRHSSAIQHQSVYMCLCCQRRREVGCINRPTRDLESTPIIVRRLRYIGLHSAGWLGGLTIIIEILFC